MTKKTKILSDTIINELKDYSITFNIAQTTKLNADETLIIKKDLKVKQERIRKMYNSCGPLTKNLVNTYIADNLKKPILTN